MGTNSKENVGLCFTHESRAVTMKLWEPKRKCPKAVPTHLQNHVVWSWILVVWSHMWPTLNQMLFHWTIYSCGSSCKIKQNKSTVVSIWSAMVSWFVLGLPPRGGFWNYSKWSWNMIHLMPRRNPCRLYIHLVFTYFVGPSSAVWSELGPASPFPPMRVLEV